MAISNLMGAVSRRIVQPDDNIWNPGGTPVAGAIVGAVVAVVVAITKPTGNPKAASPIGLTGFSSIESVIVTLVVGAVVGAAVGLILVLGEQGAKKVLAAIKARSANHE